MTPTSGLFETHLTVADLARSTAFYRDIVGLEVAHEMPERHAVFLWIGGAGHSMLGLWSIHTSPLKLRLHIAFRATLADVIAAPATLRAAGVMPRDGGGGREIDEPVVYPWMPAASVYFDDPDGHSLEYLAMMDEVPRPDLPRMTLSAWRAR